jgi:membrane dipeptidase
MNQYVKKARDNALAVLKPDQAQLERGLALHQDSVVCDAYGFSPYCLPANVVDVVREAIDAGATQAEVSQRLLNLQITGKVKDAAALAEFIEVFDDAGVTCIVQNAGEGRNLFESLERMAMFTHICDELPHVVTKAVKVSDIQRAHDQARHSLLFSLNNPIMHQAWDFWQQELYPLEIFHQAGIRIMHLTYNRRNRAGDGCAEPGNAGISDFGIDVVREMNRLGIIVDLAHAGWQTCKDAARVSNQPVVVSHSSCHALCEHVRGKPDDVIQAVVDTGGYIGICAVPPFLGRAGDITSLLDHIDYVVQKWGSSHVAIGTDTLYFLPLPEQVEQMTKPLKSKRSFWSHWPENDPLFAPGAEDDSRVEKGGTLSWTNWPLFTAGLVQRGYGDDDIRAIIGGNVMRVMREVCG